MPALCRATPESASGAVSAEELIDRGKKLDAAIEAALRVKVKAREADNWQLRRHSIRLAFPSLIFTSAAPADETAPRSTHYAVARRSVYRAILILSERSQP